MPKNNYCESQLEEATLEWLFGLGYDTVFGPSIAPDGEFSERDDYDTVILKNRLKESLFRINTSIPKEAIEEAYRQITIPQNPSLLMNNKVFQKMITDGIDVQINQGNGSFKTEKVYLFDWEDKDNNDFIAVNQFTVIENKIEKRPDIVVFVNGLPLVVIELKSATVGNVNITDAYNQLQTYKKTIPSLFAYNSFMVISDGINAKAGTLTSSQDRFMLWRTIDGIELAPKSMPQLEVLIKGMFKKETFLEIIRDFILFQSDGQETYKILAGYHQYHAVKKALEHTKTAIDGDKRIGVVWHTQGSGKSLSMVFYTAKLVKSPELKNPTIVVITDRNDLDDQLFGTFDQCKDILRNNPIQATDRENLRQLLNNRTSGGVIFTTIHKFANDEDRNIVLTDRKNVIVIADEAHRSQYGFEAEITQNKKEGTAEINYGFAKYMRDALPNASYIGFTGTPVELTDRNTAAVFGDYIDIYDMSQAVEDGTTVKIYYESRLAEIKLNENIKFSIDEDYDAITEYQEETQKEKLKGKWARLEAIVGSKERVAEIAQDVVKHFENRQLNQTFKGGKGMIVTMSRRIAIELYSEIIKLRPEWHSDDLMKGKIKVVITGASSDPADWQKFIGTKGDRETLATRMKNVDDELQLVIVRDMWLTGFDVKSLHTMYIDKPMQGHNLVQAIARVNRVFKEKQGGLIVDYIGIADSLRNALSIYTPRDRENAGVDTALAVKVMLEKLDLIREMMHGHDYSKFFTGTASEKMKTIVETMDFISGLKEDRKKDYMQHVTELARVFSLCSTTREAKKANDEVGFYKAVKIGLIKIMHPGSGTKTENELDIELNQLISKSVSSTGVIDILAQIGVSKPDISILSDEFLEEVKGMKQKNLAVELLERLIKGNIKTFERKNLIKSRKFSEMLESAILKYQNRTIETTQVILELIELAKKMSEENNNDEKSGLSSDEVAFYDALAENKTAKDVMGDEQLKRIAIKITQAIKKNLTVDWSIRENIQANMRTIVKRILKSEGYPPDDPNEPNNYQKSVEIIMKQTRLTCEERI